MSDLPDPVGGGSSPPRPPRPPSGRGRGRQQGVRGRAGQPARPRQPGSQGRVSARPSLTRPTASSSLAGGRRRPLGGTGDRGEAAPATQHHRPGPQGRLSSSSAHAVGEQPPSPAAAAERSTHSMRATPSRVAAAPTASRARQRPAATARPPATRTAASSVTPAVPAAHRANSRTAGPRRTHAVSKQAGPRQRCPTVLQQAAATRQARAGEQEDPHQGGASPGAVQAAAPTPPQPGGAAAPDEADAGREVGGERRQGDSLQQSECLSGPLTTRTDEPPPSAGPSPSEEPPPGLSARASKGLLGDDVSASCLARADGAGAAAGAVAAAPVPSVTKTDSSMQTDRDARFERRPSRASKAASGASAAAPASPAAAGGGDVTVRTPAPDSDPREGAAAGGDDDVAKAAGEKDADGAVGLVEDPGESTALPLSQKRSKGLFGDDVSVSCAAVGGARLQQEVVDGTEVGDGGPSPSAGVAAGGEVETLLSATVAVPEAAVGAPRASVPTSETAPDASKSISEAAPETTPETIPDAAPATDIESLPEKGLVDVNSGVSSGGSATSKVSGSPLQDEASAPAADGAGPVDGAPGGRRTRATNVLGHYTSLACTNQSSSVPAGGAPGASEPEDGRAGQPDAAGQPEDSGEPQASGPPDDPGHPEAATGPPEREAEPVDGDPPGVGPGAPTRRLAVLARSRNILGEDVSISCTNDEPR